MRFSKFRTIQTCQSAKLEWANLRQISRYRPFWHNLKAHPMHVFADYFQAITTDGVIDFHAWLGDSWGLFFSHPAPFTPICTTEMGSLAMHLGQFKDRNVKLCGVSCENVKCLEDWIVDIKAYYRLKDFKICLLADEDRKVARMYVLKSEVM